MKWLFIGLIKVYQWTVRPLIGDCCRYYPSCSDYALESFAKYGAIKGFWLMIKRLVRCNPYARGGHDPIP